MTSEEIQEQEIKRKGWTPLPKEKSLHLLRDRKCETCGAGFLSRYSKARYCSRRCYRRSPQRKEKERRRRNTPEYRASLRTPEQAARRIANYHRPEVKARVRDQHLRRKYGMSSAAIEEERNKRKGRCDACHKFSKTKLVIDHCHNTQGIRGFLCSSCNVILGFAQDDGYLLRKIASYADCFALLSHRNGRQKAK